MPQLGTLICDRKNCTERITEQKTGDGYKEWGAVKGKQKDGNDIYVCPECLDDIMTLLDTDRGKK